MDNVYHVLEEKLSADEWETVSRILYGSHWEELELESAELLKEEVYDIRGYKSPGGNSLDHQLVRIGAIQHSIVRDTNEDIKVQREAIFVKVKRLIDVAYKNGVNILCLQEVWSMPFAFCTREKYPWTEFAESARDGESVLFLQVLAKLYNMVIICPILERDVYEIHGGVLFNTAVVIDNHGVVLGKHRKNHIPRVGDFNESTYYMEGNTGHPVFNTKYGRIAVNICYGRHHPLNWLAFGLNGAEIVFNPSATIGSLSEPMWGIEARNAAIANTYYTVAINRVGIENYKHEFTSGDGQPAHTALGPFYGSSYIASPDNSRSPGLSRTKDGLLIGEIDLSLIREIKDKWTFQMTARYEEYKKLLEDYSKDDFIPQVINM